VVPGELDGLKASLAARASELGFDGLGFCSPAPFEQWRDVAYEQLRRRMPHDPKTLMPDAQCIVVAVRKYVSFGPWPEGSAEIANYYVNSTVGFERVKELAAVVSDAGFAAVANPLLPAKQAALRAGMGFQGMNTQFCHDRLGMLVSLHMILTDAPLAGSDSPRRECAQCGLCAAACPAGAISVSGFDHEKCLRFHMITGAVMPLWTREKMGARLVGCTLCQHACPRANIETVDVPADLAWACDIAGLLRGDEARYEKLAEYIGANFAKPKRILLQAVVSAGNSGNRAYVPQLAELLMQGNAALRCHAAWALGRLGGEEAERALMQALQTEEDGEVKREIESALGLPS
jgi:epoxyqueuosine reductase